MWPKLGYHSIVFRLRQKKPRKQTMMVASRPKFSVGELGSPEHEKDLLVIKQSHWWDIQSFKTRKCMLTWRHIFNFSTLKLFFSWSVYNRSRWPRGLKRECTANFLLGLWLLIPPRSSMSVSCECCMLSGRGLCDWPITRRGVLLRVTWNLSDEVT
jgi:hypothetical protein